MSNVDKELHEVVLGMIKDLLVKSVDVYEECRYVLLAQTTDDEKLYDFIIKLFEYTDARRPLLIGVKGETK